MLKKPLQPRMGAKPAKPLTTDVNDKDSFGHTPLDRAIFSNSLQAVTEVLGRPGVDVNLPSRGYYPLCRFV